MLTCQHCPGPLDKELMRIFHGIRVRIQQLINYMANKSLRSISMFSLYSIITCNRGSGSFNDATRYEQIDEFPRCRDAVSCPKKKNPLTSFGFQDSFLQQSIGQTKLASGEHRGAFSCYRDTYFPQQSVETKVELHKKVIVG